MQRQELEYATAPRLANFLIGGTEKAGTTSVFDYLSATLRSAHLLKETDFFAMTTRVSRRPMPLALFCTLQSAQPAAAGGHRLSMRSAGGAAGTGARAER
jgi:hypothetical protein